MRRRLERFQLESKALSVRPRSRAQAIPSQGQRRTRSEAWTLCGICGFSWEDRQLLASMSAALRHRGPDEEGAFCEPQASIAIRRLAIVDVTGGHQPYYDESGNLIVVFNGEIYNHGTLRNRLENNGHKFQTKSDGEVIVHAWEEWGPDSLVDLEGMFAFSLFDRGTRSIYLARDKFGIKPLYFCKSGLGLAFASEIRPLFMIPQVRQSPNIAKLRDFLKSGKIDESNDTTFFEDVLRIPPGHYLAYSNGSSTLKRYWDLDLALASKLGGDTPSPEELLSVLRLAVRRHLQGEVKIGTCMSGGIDSTTIAKVVSLEAANGDDYRETWSQFVFSAVFPGFEWDESQTIAQVSKSIGVHPAYVAPTAEEFWRDLPRVVTTQEEPFQSPSVYAQWRVMQEASRFVKVLLDGQGADEILAGYRGHLPYHLMGLLKGGQFRTFLRETSRHRRTLATLAKLLLRERELTRFSERVFPFKDRERTPPARKRILGLFSTSLSERLVRDLTHALPTLLRYEDRNSMAFSLEARVPFLDSALVLYCLALPDSLKISDGMSKVALRKAMHKLLPASTTESKTKIGFETPDAEWLKANADRIIEILRTSTLATQGLVDSDFLLKSFEKFVKQELPDCYSCVFWRVLSAELWLRYVCKAPNS